VSQSRADSAGKAQAAILMMGKAQAELIAASSAGDRRVGAVLAIKASSTIDESIQRLQQDMPESADVAELARLLKQIEPGKMRVIRAVLASDAPAARTDLRGMQEAMARMEQISEEMVRRENTALLDAVVRQGVQARFTLRVLGALVLGCGLLGVAVVRRFAVQQSLLEGERKVLRTLIDNIPDFMWVKDTHSRFVVANLASARALGAETAEEITGRSAFDFLPKELAAKRYEQEQSLIQSGEPMFNQEDVFFDSRGNEIQLLMTKVPLRDSSGRVTGIAGIGRDITDRKQSEREREKMEIQMRHSQKLESIGQLAAGIAHEINTPIQFVGDNMTFLSDSFQSLAELLAGYEGLPSAVREGAPTADLLETINNAIERVDRDYLLKEIPLALRQAKEGVDRVATLVRAMKEFSHPGVKAKSLVDLNRAIETTVAVSRNEWKYVADLETEFDAGLPMVSCLPGEINQVILNLIVNAAHAVGDVIGKGGGDRGKITIRTLNLPDWVEIHIRDTGTGIPEEVQKRIFDPFFTTKEVGKGTGQGLAIAHSVVVDKHQGTIHFETESGKGTTFIVRLPHEGRCVPVDLVLHSVGNAQIQIG
jgi:PAS domain S-box-containing protein